MKNIEIAKDLILLASEQSYRDFIILLDGIINMITFPCIPFAK